MNWLAPESVLKNILQIPTFLNFTNTVFLTFYKYCIFKYFTITVLFDIIFKNTVFAINVLLKNPGK